MFENNARGCNEIEQKTFPLFYKYTEQTNIDVKNPEF